MTLTATDLFAGAGGSSLGAEGVDGVTIDVAANHWQTAVDVHQSHFPNARHDCADISQADPRRYPRTDILIASPECTNHSQARGVSRKKQQPSLWDAPDPSAERSRATMWDVPRFAEQMDYEAIVVENVVDVKDWVLWDSWLHAMDALGYERQILSINSMHYGVAQSRDRVFIVLWKPGLRVNLEREGVGWCNRCEAQRSCRQSWKNGRTIGKYGDRQQWVWTCIECRTVVPVAGPPASSIIDWSLPCPRLGDRGVTDCFYCGRNPCRRHWKALVPATRDRILAGIERYCTEPFITAGAGHVYETTPGNRSRPLDQPLPVQGTTTTHALATPPGSFAINTAHSGRLHDLGQPHPTVCAHDDRLSLVVPLRNNGNPHPTTDPLGVVAAGGNHHALLMRNNGGGAEMITPVDEPARTVTTKGHQSLLMPYYSNGQARPVGAGPVPTVSTRDRCAIIDPDTVVDDCGFRMLEPHEIAAAMAFPDGYIPGDLPKKHQVRLAGNAVTPPVMTWIVERIAEAIGSAA